MRHPTELEIQAKEARCWFAVDRVAGDAATTDWKRRARLGQARWREGQGLAIGYEPYIGGPTATPVGSRIGLALAKETAANFLTMGARRAVNWRLGHAESHQMLSQDRLWADLLSSMPMCFNLFGDMFDDDEAATRAVERLWPEAPRGQATLRFEHSPGRLDPRFLGNRSAFDAAFDIAVSDGGRAVIGIETKYHEHAKREAPPVPGRLQRYMEVTERSGIFKPGWFDTLVGTDLQQIWLDHLLVLAMLQHPSARWTWGRFVLVFPAANPSFGAAAQRYRDVLRDERTFQVLTLEDVLAVPRVFTEEAKLAFSNRYLQFE